MATKLKINTNRLNMDTHSPRRRSYGRKSGIFKPRRRVFICGGGT